MPDTPTCFLSYAREDLAKVRRIYEELERREVDVWFDEVELKPGEWKPQIERAIQRCRYFIICLSRNALRKTGPKPSFQDEELAEAYRIAKLQSRDAFAIVPMRLEDCERGDHRLSVFSQYDLFPATEFADRLDVLAIDLGGVTVGPRPTSGPRRDLLQPTRRLLGRAQAALSARDLEGALVLVDKALEVDPELAEAHHLRACILESGWRLDEALEAYSNAVSREPRSARMRNNRALVLEKLDRLPDALSDLEQALFLHPQHSTIYANRARIRRKLGDVDAAVADYDRALSLDPEFSGALVGRAVALAGEPVRARADIERALELDPESAVAFHTRAHLHYANRELKAALADLDQALALSPDFRDAYFKRAIVREDLGDCEGAIEDYSEAIRLDATSVAYANRAGVRNRKGDVVGAIRDLERAVEIDPDDLVAARDLANLRTLRESVSFLSKLSPKGKEKFAPDFLRGLGLDEDEEEE